VKNRLLALLAALSLLLLGSVAVAGAAQAWDGDTKVSSSSVCSNGQTTITWKLSNSSWADAKVQQSDAPSVVPVGSIIPKNGSQTFTQVVSTVGTYSLSGKVNYPGADKKWYSYSGSITVGTCKPTQPPTLTGTNSGHTAPICVTPLNGQATYSTWKQDWSTPYVWSDSAGWGPGTTVYGDKVTTFHTVAQQSCTPPVKPKPPVTPPVHPKPPVKPKPPVTPPAHPKPPVKPKPKPPVCQAPPVHPKPTAHPAPPVAPPSNPNLLPHTGADNVALFGMAGLLAIVAGGLALVAARRRRRF
jgi:LPXTG-motif cell wall-anchored protein